MLKLFCHLLIKIPQRSNHTALIISEVKHEWDKWLVDVGFGSPR